MEDKIKRIIVYAFIAIIILLAAWVVWPVALSVVTGLIMAYVFMPLYRRVLRVVKEKNISALIIVLVIVFLIFIPLWFLFPIIARQIFDVYTFIQKVDVPNLLKIVLPQAVSTDSATIVSNIISKGSGLLFDSFSGILVDLPNLLLQAVVIFFVFFFAMRDFETLKSYVKSISPFSSDLEDTLSKQFKDMTNAVIYGHIITGIVQGVLTGIGLFVTGVPQALLLTVLAVFFSIIPVLGAWLIWIPASIYLFATGHVGMGIGLFLFGAIVISWVDNIMRPYIISKRTNISSGVVFVGMIGGLFVFGVIGLIIGPLILGYFITLLDGYRDKRLSKFFSS